MIPVVEELQRRRAATTPTGGRWRSAPASAATRRSSPPPPTSPPRGSPSGRGADRLRRLPQGRAAGHDPDLDRAWPPATSLSATSCSEEDRCPTRSSNRRCGRSSRSRPTTRSAPAARRVIEAGLPALPAVDDDGRFAGIFGEREFMAALFPGYVGELASAAMISRYDRRDDRAPRAVRERADPPLPDHRPRRRRGRLLRHPAGRALPSPPGPDRPDRDRGQGARRRHPQRLLPGARREAVGGGSVVFASGRLNRGDGGRVRPQIRLCPRAWADRSA